MLLFISKIVFGGGVYINTPGWKENQGIDYIQGAIENFKVDTIIVID